MHWHLECSQAERVRKAQHNLQRNEPKQYSNTGNCETNWNSSGSFKSHDYCKVIFSGRGTGYSHGVTVILTKETANALIRYNPVSDRILKVYIIAKPYNLSIIQWYAPTSTASDEELDEFYSQLQETMDEVPHRDIKIVIGDMNVKVGSAITGTSTYGICRLDNRNERGEFLIDFCETNNLILANTLLEQHPRRLYTWTLPDCTNRNQIDYIMINQKWKSCLKDVRTLSGADFSSDHQLLAAWIQMRLKKITQPPTPLRLDFSTLDETYKIDINNKFQTLLECDFEEILPDEMWELGIEKLIQVAKRTIKKSKE